MLHNEHYVAVGIDVKRVNQGKNKPILEVNSIKTVFAKGTERIADDEVPVAVDKNITPEQQALLRGHNFHEYPTIQELSVAKLGNNSESPSNNAENVSAPKVWGKKDLLSKAEQASLGAVYALHHAGVIPQVQLAEMVDGARGNERLSALGREFLENMLIGKAFAGNPEAVRMLTEVPSMRQSVVMALGEISDNVALGKDWSLQDELAEAVKLCHDARKGGVGYGAPVSWTARQYELFADVDGLKTAADMNNARRRLT